MNHGYFLLIIYYSSTIIIFGLFNNIYYIHGQTCKTSYQKLKVADIKTSKVDYPTGDKKFSVLEAFPSPFDAVEEVDPFLICHEWGTSKKIMGMRAIDPGKPKEKQKKHVGWHPHRGFDIVSYVKEGRGSHADSMGNVAIVRSGGIQWMRTASGIEHAEGGGNPKNANKHGFQLWINLPSHLKMSKPAYGTIQPEKIPEMVSPDSVRTRYIAGWNSAAFLDRVGDFTIIDVEMPSNTKHKLHIPPHLLDTILVYSYRGSAGTVNLKKLKPHSIARLIVDSSKKNNKDDVHNKEEEEGIRNGANCTNYNMDQSAIIELKSYNSDFGVIVFAGKRINEKIAWRGPIVMNTWGEINLAYKELRNGNFLKERVNYNYRNV